MARITHYGPFLGINGTKHPRQLGYGEAASCHNLDLSAGTIKKRPGTIEKVDLSTTGEPLGGHNYYKVSGSTTTVYDLVKSGDRLFIFDEWSGTDLAESLSLENLADFATLNNRVYYCDGTAFRVTDGATCYSVTITRPSAPAASTVSVGNLTGTYDYKVAYYSSTWGQESAASDVTTSVSPAATQVRLALTASTDGRVDKIRIYRRKTSASEALWYYVTETTNTTGNWDDNILDASVSQTSLAPLSFSTSVPTFRYMAQQGGILALAGDPTYPNRVYFTRPNEPWAVYDYIDFGSGLDSDQVGALAAFKGVFIVWTSTSMWIVSGTSADDFIKQKIDPGVGCRSHHGVVNVGDYLYFLAEESFYVFDGSTVMPISGEESQDPIRSDVTSRNYAREQWVVGGHLPEYGAIIWTFSSETSDENDQVYVHFYEHSRRMQYPSWCPWGFDAACSWIGRLADPTTRRIETYFGLSNGSLRYLGGTTDETAEINHYWRTGQLGGDAVKQKAWKELEVEFTPVSSASTCEVRHYLDDSASYTTLVSHDQTTPVARGRIGRSSRYITLEFNGTTSRASEILGFALDAEQVGR